MNDKSLISAAFVYDYDGTLAKGNIQEASFLPELGIERSEFWDEVKKRTKDEDGNEILTYMQLMLKKARAGSQPVDRDFLRLHGNTSELFPGLADGGWFERVNKFAEERGITLKHYIVSSGIKEMIEGSPISKYFEHIFASKFSYGDDGRAQWPAAVIDYTAKTQCLFRINKGIDNSWDSRAINKFMPEKDRPVPFERMVFFGDGDTDIPSMKMLTMNGGASIAVYEEDEKSREKVHSLISDGRVEFTAVADYSENSQLDIAAKGILGRIARKNGYLPK
ncbi:HAD family hydrolase [Maritalea sp.]|uniref:HAD family hydrolase n=1 Tax=Maritalea sp. TaxID=2003361 RepID=UPI003EF72C14